MPFRVYSSERSDAVGQLIEADTADFKNSGDVVFSRTETDPDRHVLVIALAAGTWKKVLNIKGEC